MPSSGLSFKSNESAGRRASSEAINPGDDLWTEYKRRRSPDLRERIILENAPLVKHVAGRIAIALPPSVELDDLVNYGIFGLIDAIERYEPERGVKFSTYAVARIKGAILDGLREMDWVPQSVRQKAKQLEATYGELEARLGRSATDQEVADELGIRVDEFSRLVQSVSGAAMLSLEELCWPGGDGEEGGPCSIPDPRAEDPQEECERNELKRALAEAIELLPDKEKTVVSLYYYNGLTGKEICKVMGLSPSRVSQLHSKAILRLRGRLGRQKKWLLQR